MKIKLLPILLIGLSLRLSAQSPGSLDLSFDPGDGTNTLVESIAIQADGKILIGGPFNSYDGTSINGIARLNIDGSLDTSFDPGDGVMGFVTGQQYHVYDIAVQSDGKIILVGAFHNYDNTPRDRIVRLNSDGSIDISFDPNDGADSEVRTIAILPDGDILIGGSFTRYYNTSNSPYIARINPDGTKDNGFTPGTGASSAINSLHVQADGKILIGGDFTSYDGNDRNGVARLNADGSLDNSFDPGAGSGGVFPSVRSVRVQNDGKVIASGYFDSFDGTTRGKIARLNADGSLDNSFDPGSGADLNSIHKIEILPNYDIILVGSFYSYDGSSRNSIARINADGSLDSDFDPGFGCNNTGEALAIQSDGKVLIGGNFTMYDGTQRDHIARINNDGVTGIDPKQNSILLAYPNPSQGVFRVLVEHSYRIVNSTGAVVSDWTSSPVVDLSEYEQGVYFLHTNAGEIIKLVKN